MKKIIILMILIISILILIAGCSQKQIKPIEVAPATIESADREQICIERWICADDNTKAYRKSDCTFEQITNCPAGCENGDCKKVIEEPKKEETKEEPKQETKVSCAIGWACLDNKRWGYRYSNCMFDNVDECKYGCKDNACITTPPPEEKKEETFSLTEGNATMDVGFRYCDFSKKQIFLKEVDDQDVKIQLYSKAENRDYIRATSPRADLWIIEKGIREATRADCMEEITKANAYMNFKSGQTLCIKTKEGNIALIGGYWENVPTENTQLSWKYYS